MLHNRQAKHINSHANFEVIGWLFPVTIELAVAIQLDYAKIDLHLSRKQPQRKIGLLGTVKFNHAAKIESGKQIAVHHDEGVCQAWNERERAGCSERFFFVDILDAQPKFRSVSANSLNKLGKVAGADGDICETRGGKTAQQDVYHRLVPKRHKRFGKDGGKRTTPGSFPSRQIYRARLTFFVHRC